MPHIEENELVEMTRKIENAKYAERKLEQQEEETRKFKIASILLGILAFLGLAGSAYYTFFKSDTKLTQSDFNNSEYALTLKDSINILQEQLANASTFETESQASDPTNDQEKKSLKEELVYAVQIGAFEKKDLSLYSGNFVNFKEIKKGKFNKYALGNFASLNEAQRFRKEIVTMGFKNAFIASYQNGERIKIEEAW